MNNLLQNNKKTKLSVIGAFCLIATFVLVSPVAVAQTGEALSEQEKATAVQLNNANRRAVEIVRPAVVSISVSKHIQFELLDRSRADQTMVSLGSGCIIDKRGYIITNNHVVAETDTAEVILADGRRFEAVETLTDPDTDLALVRIELDGEDLPVAQFGDSDQAQVGDFVLAIGSPFGLSQTVTSGIISYKGRQTGILETWGYEDFIQTDADINQGNSGGPLVNLYGEVIGITSNIYTPTGVSAGYGFAVPSNLAKFVAERLIAEKQVRRGWLGVEMIGIDDLRKIPTEEYSKLPSGSLRQFLQDNLDFIKEIPKSIDGIVVSGVLPDDPADKAGIKVKDIILSVNGIKTVDSFRFRSYIATLKPAETAKFTLWRDGQEITLSVTLGDRAAAVAREKDKSQPSDYAQREPEGMVPIPLFPDPFGESPQEEPPKLGVTVQPLNPSLAREYGYDKNLHGLVISGVLPGSVAQQSGLKTGDIIVSVNGVRIETGDQLKEIIQKADLTTEGVEIIVRNQTGQRTITAKRQDPGQ